jgi:general secretion pathway protein A
MYQSFYGLCDLPFELTADPKFLFLSARHREALSNLEYGLSAAKSMTVMLGEAGTGKTTVIRAALASERCRNVKCVYINNPVLTREEFVYTLATRLDLSADAARSKAVLIEELEGVLVRRRARGEVVALVIDEAQRLSPELLEEIRLLGNIESPTQKLLPRGRAGQRGRGARLEDPSLRQTKQRVALRCELAAFDMPETAAYIASRILSAGGIPSRLFTKEAVGAIHDCAGGIPRTIGVLCDNALLAGMAMDRSPVDLSIVAEVAKDFALDGRITPARAAPAIPSSRLDSRVGARRLAEP